MDPWHAYAQGVVHQTAREWYDRFGRPAGERILNAGSGGSDYGIRAPMTHFDLVAERVAHCERYLVGDIAQIPAQDHSFDVVLCVGSVLNYADPLPSIREFSRVLRPGGRFIVEYERSGSCEYRYRTGFERSCCQVRTFYGRVATSLWVYGDGFIDGLLAASGFQPLAERRFHAFSSLVLALSKSSRLAARFTAGDQLLAQHWPLKAIASNRLLAVEKLAH